MGSMGDAVSPGDHLPSVLAVRLAREEEVRELLHQQDCTCLLSTYRAYFRLIWKV